MRKFKFLTYIFSILGLMMTSCDPSVDAPGSNNGSAITYLPLITLEGETSIVLPCDGSVPYEDPGAIAEAGGTQIDLTTSVNGKYFGVNSVNDGPDVYLVSYSAFNEDDIPATANREVLYPECNGDLITSIAGMYTASVSRNGSSPAGYQDNGPFIIRDLGDNRYAISDAQGGWYEYGRGLGVAYATLGMVLVANNIPTNDFTSEGNVTTNTFGGSNTFISLTVDPVAGTLTLTVDWDFGYTFETVFTQTDEYY